MSRRGLADNMRGTRRHEQAIDPAATGFAWWTCYETLPAGGSALAWRQKWRRTTLAWATDTEIEKRTIYDRPDGVGAAAGDTVGCVLMPSSGRWEVIDKPGVTELVQVFNAYTGTEELGDLQEPNDDGYHYGRMVRWTGGALVPAGFCWIRFVDFESTDLGQVVGEYGRTYGPFRHSGLVTATLTVEEEDPVETELPVYVGEIGEQTFVAKPDTVLSKGATGEFHLYHRDPEVDSGVSRNAKALTAAVEELTLLWSVTRLRSGIWIATPIECDEEA